MAGLDFAGDDDAATAALVAAMDTAPRHAVSFELDTACAVSGREFFALKKSCSENKYSLAYAWDVVDHLEKELWEYTWNWLELMKIRIAQTYRLRPVSLSWVFDKLEVEALCNCVGGGSISVPSIASWRKGGMENWKAVAEAVESNIPLIVKPTHGSQSLGVAVFDEPQRAGMSAVNAAIDAALEAMADPTEPWMLRAVPNGVLVQELYKSEEPCRMKTPPFSCPLELKVQMLFGCVICGTVRAFPWQLTVLPDGSVHQWSNSRVVHARGLPKAWRAQWGSAVPAQTLEALRKVLAADWVLVSRLSTAIARASRLDEVRIDWLLGDPRLGPRVGELQYVGAAGNIRPHLQQPLCRAFLLCHKLRAATAGRSIPRILASPVSSKSASDSFETNEIID
eukprot:TRINITY_DN4709_c2_g1_i1.p1 TRINITY_DN4709_c2_g1~~TRINITY_DN4709_c2_g1_i1.p1  ORF type:complete len:396 (+),score=69.22 TRINITY_DN4709_c2_g1_i1:132-1319(+)